MNRQDSVELETQEPFTVQVKKPSSNQRCTIGLWLRRLCTLNDVPRQKCHAPIFIIVMTIIHLSLYLLTFSNRSWKRQPFFLTLLDLFKLFVPCMRPTSIDIRNRIVHCDRIIKNGTCYYDDVLKHICFSFMYPHQLWRMITVNLLHLSWLHLLSNLLIQLIPGILLERKYGTARIACVYWLSNIGANFAFILKHEQEPAFGASGALYGVMAFLIVERLVKMSTDRDHCLFILVQLFLALLPHFSVSIPMIIKYNVAHSAHVGGGLIGFLLGLVMFGSPLPWLNENNLCQIICQRTALIALMFYFGVFLAKFFLTNAPPVDMILARDLGESTIWVD